MCYSPQFTSWLKENYKAVNLTSKELNWVSSFFPGYFDFESYIEIDGRKLAGRGIAKSRDLAAEKSITEAIERAVFLSTSKEDWNQDFDTSQYLKENMTTNGFSLHVSIEKSAMASSLELIERDLFLCHYLTQIPFLDTTYFANSNHSLFSVATEKLSSYGVTLKLGELYKSDNFSCYVCIAFGEEADQHPFGTIVGLGCDVSQNNAIDKSVFECIPNVLLQVQGHENKILSEDEFVNLKKFRPLDHLYLGKNLDNVNYLKVLSSGKELYIKEEVEHQLFNSIEINEIELPDWCVKSGLVATRAYSSKLQQLFFGVTQEEKINFDRLSDFSNKNITFEDIQRYPHPFA